MQTCSIYVAFLYVKKICKQNVIFWLQIVTYIFYFGVIVLIVKVTNCKYKFFLPRILGKYGGNNYFRRYKL